MKVFVFCALIFCFETVFAEISITPYYTFEANKTVVFSLNKPLVLSCNITADSSIKTNELGIEWKKEETSVMQIPSLKERVKMTSNDQNYTLTVSNGQNDDVGNWSCHALLAGQVQASAQIQVVSHVSGGQLRLEYPFTVIFLSILVTLVAPWQI